MAFTEKSWRERVAESLRGVGIRLQGERKNIPFFVYGTLAGMTLWPLVEQAAKTGDLIAVTGALFAIAGNIGTNLIANQIQKWHDQAESPTEEVVIDWINQQIVAEAEISRALDNILTQLKVMPQAQASLTAQDRKWFRDQLQQEMSALGNWPRFEASLSGSGAIAQGDHAVAVGERGVNAPGNTGLIITGDNPYIEKLIISYTSQENPAVRAETLRTQIADYLRWIDTRYGAIVLRGIGQKGNQVRSLTLETAFVPLTVEVQIPEEVKGREIYFHTIHQAGQRLVLTGGPGSGKTTALLYMARTLAASLAAEAPELAQARLGLAADADLPIPFFIPLNQYAAYLRQLGKGTDPKARLLATFIPHYFTVRQVELPEDFLQQLMHNGRQMLLLLDGLDEIADSAERDEVRQAIEDFVALRQETRVIVTCRTAAYRQQTVLDSNFCEIHIHALPKDQVETFIRYACAALYPDDVSRQTTKANALWKEVSQLEDKRRQRFGPKTPPLINSPLMIRLLLIVSIRNEGRALPDQRAKLYMQATDAILQPDYGTDVMVAHQLGRLIGGNLEIHRDLVQYIAFHMHERGPQQGQEIDKRDLRHLLQQNSKYVDYIDDFLDLTELRGTLLEADYDQYRFIHHAFQEYMTARYLAEVTRSEGGVEAIAAYLETDRVTESWWREVALLTAGYLGATSPRTAPLFLSRLASVDEAAPTRRTLLPAAVQMAAAELAAAAYLEIRPQNQDLSQSLVRRLVTLLTDMSVVAETSATLRAMAGDALAHLGDPRSGVGVLPATDHHAILPDIDLCYVPPGPFWMGSEDEESEVDQREVLQHSIDLNYGYWIGRYPVTVTQFNAFVTHTDHPITVTAALQKPANHPIQDITWDDALAFCRWLTTLALEQARIPQGWFFTLPSETEWEKAARGGLQVPGMPVIGQLKALLNEPTAETLAMEANSQPRRLYPWGDEIDSERANYKNTGILTTNTVGIFPQGMSPYGLLECSGNVGEWTRSLYKGYPYQADDGRENLEIPKARAVRGGFFWNDAAKVRCAFRKAEAPHHLRGYGFRVVLRS